MYLDLGARRDQTEFHLNFTGADNWALSRPPRCNCSIDAGRCLHVAKTTPLQVLEAAANFKSTDTSRCRASAMTLEGGADRRRGHCKEQGGHKRGTREAEGGIVPGQKTALSRGPPLTTAARKCQKVGANESVPDICGKKWQ
jgi:hypothetical protein